MNAKSTSRLGDLQLPEHRPCRGCKGRHGSATGEIHCLEKKIDEREKRIDELESEMKLWLRAREAAKAARALPRSDGGQVAAREMSNGKR